MKKLFSTSLFPVIVFFFTFSSNSTIVAGDAPKLVGVKTCGMCHKKDAEGNQLKVWQDSKHANAYKTLQSEEADKIAKDKGIDGKAAEAKECLVCHASGYDVDASLLAKNFKVEEGVQCETCHGAGGKFKKKSTMKDHAKAVAAGLVEYKDEAAIKTQCVTCHNEESPTFKYFDFDKRWAEIAHDIPKK